jgi:SAM-dependent methyltransferase
MSPAGEWEPDAENWARWARAPGHDAYWYYRRSFFELVAAAPRGRCVEVGCGEGRVARDLSALGYRVTGVDSSAALLRYAREADCASSYVLADSAALPFADGAFDLAVAYNSLQVVADMAGTVREAARVVARGGCFCACVSHPLTDMGRFVGQSPEAAFSLRADYFARHRVHDTVERDGLEMTFRGWTYTLQDYAQALQDAGLSIQAMREPRPCGDAPAAYAPWNRYPMFLLIRTVKARTPDPHSQSLAS